MSIQFQSEYPYAIRVLLNGNNVASRGNVTVSKTSPHDKTLQPDHDYLVVSKNRLIDNIVINGSNMRKVLGSRGPGCSADAEISTEVLGTLRFEITPEKEKNIHLKVETMRDHTDSQSRSPMFTMAASDGEHLSDLRARLQSHPSVALEDDDEILLGFRGRKLKDYTKSLRQLNMIEDSVIYVSQKRNWGPQGIDFNLIINTLNGEPVGIKIDSWATVEDLKTEISTLKGFPVEDIRLLYRGKGVYGDDRKLGEFGICNGSSVHAVFRLRPTATSPSQPLSSIRPNPTKVGIRRLGFKSTVRDSSTYTWDWSQTKTFSVQILNTIQLTHFTSVSHPESPIMPPVVQSETSPGKPF
ncbi:hypothetical protein K432DRAFT_402304 [Lepidopterella palustris CBS 459.81]|uniref:Ubiquitin-like domain-containing protein n=1 Tax=Lepidopterella palustris CBS 459.81 TaxID=1314670 RepID=A0A8E2EG06_9PEZI|nr:hypothetical protein K432DRAFT_402304 [Lepidopterella palustris CBS 459.81]